MSADAHGFDNTIPHDLLASLRSFEGRGSEEIHSHISRLPRSWRGRRLLLAALWSVAIVSLLADASGSSNLAVTTPHVKPAAAAPAADSTGETRSRLLYGTAMARIANTWDKGAVRDLRRQLDRLKPASGAVDTRGFEWRYYSALFERELGTLQSGSKVLCEVAY